MLHNNKMISYFLLLFLIAISNVSTAPRVDPLVDSKFGLIRGLKASDGEYSMFMGIPYGVVDEENPFGPSTPHPGFDEVFEAYDDSAICPQIEEFNNTLVGTLDCLHLNIYVPNSATSINKLPVLIWVHGGGFSVGFSGRFIYGPKYLVRHDVILVTLNYRLGPYGFMCLDTPEVPGNQGLKDQELGLKWIKDNIAAFGGDTDKITIHGESAGSASVDMQLLYGEENLFNKIIMQSGNALGPWTVTDPDLSAPIKLAAHLGIETDNINEALSFLATVDTKLIIAASSEISLSFAPCVEKKFDNVVNFITDYPINIQTSKVKNMPVLIGVNDDEALFIYANQEPQFFETLNIFFERLNATFDFNDEELTEMERLLRHFYIGDEEISEQSKRGITDFHSDINFNYPTVRTIEKYAESEAENVFYYVFSYLGGRNFVKDRLNITVGGASHADEMGYLFDISYMSDEPSVEDQVIIDQITTMWTNFVKFGNPTPETTDLLPVKWTPVTSDVLYYLDIDSELSVKKRLFNKRMAFWDLFYILNGKVQKGYKD